jgi:hypothetical protein
MPLMGLGKGCPCLPKLWISLNRTFPKVDRLGESAESPLVVVITPQEEQIVGLLILRWPSGDTPLLVGRQFRLKRLGDLLGYFALYREDIRHITIKSLRPQIGIARYIDQLGDDS